MHILPLRPDLEKYLKLHQLTTKFQKQLRLLSANPRHPSLHCERLLPKNLGLYSIRIDRKYRAIFIILDNETVEFVKITDHYQ